METLIRCMASRLAALLAAFALALAPGVAQAQPAYSFSQQELDQMLAPVALYPDALLSQILMAATYPLEVLEAARWARDRPDLSGDEAVREADTENWDPSVKSLVAFPQVLARMGENLQWTQALGDAFLDQQPQVMDTVQALRRRAQAAGNLRPDDRMSVVESGTSLMLQPYDSQIVYVPYYDPLVVYGSWWWPAYPPVYLRPWPGYYARPAYAGGFHWGAPVAVSAGFFFGAIDWRQRQASVVHVDTYYYNKLGTPRQANVNPQPGATRPGAWHHDPVHRGGLAYRSGDAQRRFGAASVAPAPRGQARAADARTDARFEARRPDTRSGVETRPNARTAPPAPVEIRIEGRRPDAQPAARTGALPANLGPPVNASRIEIRPAPSAARQESATTATPRHEPAGHHQAPQASPARTETPAAGAVPRQPDAKAVARPKTTP